MASKQRYIIVCYTTEAFSMSTVVVSSTLYPLRRFNPLYNKALYCAIQPS